MRKNEIQVGKTYIAKVSNRIVPVRVVRDHSRGGWYCKNEETGRELHIKTAQRLRRPSAPANPSPSKATKSQRTGDAPRSQLDLAETKKLEAARDKKANAKAAADGKAKTKRLSALDAAAKVLVEAGQSMTTKEMIEAMTSKGLWTSPGGKTPHGTLHSAISREIATRGDESRFRKADRGKFAATS